MIVSLKNRNVQMRWITKSPTGDKKIALLIPQYNEASNGDIRVRLSYFKKIANDNRALDVIIIDDGSTDNSLEEIRDFLKDYPNAFFVAAVSPNANKVGALYITALNINNNFVILSDFDTDLINIIYIYSILDKMANDSKLMGCHFSNWNIRLLGFIIISIFEKIAFL